MAEVARSSRLGGSIVDVLVEQRLIPRQVNINGQPARTSL
jgi:hypothetical protein